MTREVAFTGADASAEAMRQINPDVVPAYPITPQTPIAQKFAQFVADGIVDTEMIRVESEHSAMSATVGAAAAGARAMTATSSAGLALMWEILGIASGLRLPIVMSVVNRALSGPINIHCDHSDSMGCRDHSWIQIYSENAQEAYEHTLLATRLAEHRDVLLPVMVCQDGFITSHGVENVTIHPDNAIKKFIGDHRPRNPLLDTGNAVTIGPLQLTDYLFETKRQQVQAMENAKKIFLDVGKELAAITKNSYGYVEEYRSKDAEVVLVALNSACGTIKAVIDELRQEGKKVGLLKIRLFRPFMYEEVAGSLEKAKVVCVLDRAESYGANAPLFSEVKNSLYDLAKKPELQSCIFGIGGRDLMEEDIKSLYNDLLSAKTTRQPRYIGLRE